MYVKRLDIDSLCPRSLPDVTIELEGRIEWKDLDIIKKSLGKEIGFRVRPIEIEKVIFNDPATIVIWNDGTKTVVKCQDGDIYDKETGLAMCCAKKLFDNKSNFNNVFKKHIPEESNVYNETFKEFGEMLSSAINGFCDGIRKKRENKDAGEC